jgi:hypothetical protein
MASIPGKVADRLIAGIKSYQPKLAAAKKRDVGEADTATIIKYMLTDIFGYDAFSDITAELPVKSTRCDLAIRIDGTISTVIEVKAIGTELKASHVDQAVDYATKLGVTWAILTNGISWRVYHVIFH